MSIDPRDFQAKPGAAGKVTDADFIDPEAGGQAQADASSSQRVPLPKASDLLGGLAVLVSNRVPEHRRAPFLQKLAGQYGVITEALDVDAAVQELGIPVDLTPQQTLLAASGLVAASTLALLWSETREARREARRGGGADEGADDRVGSSGAARAEPSASNDGRAN